MQKFKSIIILATILVLTSCSEQSYDLSLKDKPFKTQSFNSVRSIIPAEDVDLTVVLDTSHSMGDEIELIKRNLTDFINNLSTFSNVRINFVANESANSSLYSKETAYGTLSYPQLFNFDARAANNSGKVSQVDKLVYSHDGPEILLNALKNKELNLRSNALSAYLFITDDNYAKLTNVSTPTPEFIAAINEGLNFYSSSSFINQLKAVTGKTPIIYGIIGHTSPLGSFSQNCYGTERTGSFYIDAANKTNGKVWSICTQDWNQMFQEIAGDIEEKLNVSYKLSSTPSEIAYVRFNGRTLNESEYSMENNILTVSRELFDNTDSGKVTIEYR